MILVPLHRTKNAVRFQEANANSTYVILGQTSPWTDDTHPPAPNPSTSSINQQFVALKANVLLVIEDEVSGTYQFRDSQGNIRKFSQVTSVPTFISDGGTLVLITASADCNALLALTASFRQLGVATDLVPATGHTSDTFLPAANITSWGNLETVENRTPVALIADETYNVNSLIQY